MFQALLFSTPKALSHSWKLSGFCSSVETWRLFKDAEDIPVPDDPPPFPVKTDKKTGILLIGFKVSLKGGHENSDWVCNLMLNSNLNFVVLPSFLKDNSV